jgi:putative aldouronate transport system substrate-binding protein
MKKRNRIISGILAATMAAGMCVTAGAAENTEDVKSRYPVSEDKLELTVFAAKPATIEDLDTNLFTQELEELTNVHIKWQTCTEDGLNEKRNVLFASGSYPDVLLNANITKEEQMLYGEQGVLIPLNDLIEEHSVEFKKLLDEIEWLRPAITAPDGNIYALPQINECYHCTMGQKLWINQTWLDNLNLEMPTTTEEFEQVLLAFKNDDPNGNGQPDEIPMSGAISGWNTGVENALLNAFIYNDGSTDSYRVLMEDGKVAFAPAQEKYKEGLKWIKGLYDQGLIDPAAFTQPSDQYKQMGMSEEAIIGVGAAGAPIAFTQMGSERMGEYVAVPPLTGPDGTCYTAYNPIGMTGGAFAITNANKNPVETIKWIDYLYSEEGTRRANEGREGEEWIKPEEGVLGINGEQAKWLRASSLSDVQNVVWQGMAIGAVTEDYRLSEVAGEIGTTEGFEAFMYQETKEKYDGHQPEEFLPDVYVMPEDLDEMAQIKGPLLDYVEQSAAKFITGAMDLDAEWDSYLENLNKLKTDRYVEILQNAYDNSAFKK